MNDEENEQLAQEWYDRKTSHIEAVLGKEHDIVMHAVIPFFLGGGLDLYYFPNGVSGTAIATRECSESPNEESTNDAFDLYELAMFTKHQLSLDDAHDESTPFGKAHSNISAILNFVVPYSAQATLNPNETCEFPEDMESVGGKCLIFDAYGEKLKTRIRFGILAVIEIFRSEMAFARKNGGAKLLAKLKKAGHYPYSDLEREPVA